MSTGTSCINKIYMPRKLSKNAKDIILQLLIRDPSERLGANGAEEILEHPFFKGIDWKKVYRKGYKPPYIPRLQSDLDLKNI